MAADAATMLHCTKTGAMLHRNIGAAPQGVIAMYEQATNQWLSLSKQAAETFVKANAIAVDAFEKLVDIHLKHFEESVKLAVDLAHEAAEMRDFDAMRAALPKGVSLVKDTAEKFYATTQEVSGVLIKSGQALSQLLKGSMEAVNDTVGKTEAKATKRATA
jgi:hypothetical protein